MERLEVGRIGRAHGLSGEVAVTFSSNRAERHAPGAELWIGDRRLVIDSARPHQQRWLIRFVGIDDRDAAESLRGAVLTAAPLGRLPDGEHWVHELVGAEVRDTLGHVLGRVAEVEANPANDLLVLEGGGLLPVPFVVGVHDGVVVADPPDGLLD